MTKVKLLKIINPILILSALIQLLGGLFMIFSFIVPFLGEIHEINGLVLSGIIVIHFILNWTWVKNTFFARKSTVK